MRSEKTLIRRGVGPPSVALVRLAVLGLALGLLLAVVMVHAAGSSASVAPGTVGWGYGGPNGRDDFGQATVPAGLTGVTAIAVGTYHNLALKSDGTLVAWGLNTAGEGSVPAGLKGVTAIAAGSLFNLALKSDGTVLGWGWDFAGQADPPSGLTGVTAIGAGGNHSLALKSDGTSSAGATTSTGRRLRLRDSPA